MYWLTNIFCGISPSASPDVFRPPSCKNVQWEFAEGENQTLDSFACKIVGQDLIESTNMNWLIAAFPRLGKKWRKWYELKCWSARSPNFLASSLLVQQLVVGEKGKLEIGSLLSNWERERIPSHLLLLSNNWLGKRGNWKWALSWQVEKEKGGRGLMKEVWKAVWGEFGGNFSSVQWIATRDDHRSGQLPKIRLKICPPT